MIREPGKGAVGSYTVTCVPEGVRIELRRNENGKPFVFVVDPEAAYDLTQDVLRCYDRSVGIAPVPPLREY